MPVAALEDPRVRGDFKDWRDTFAATPRKADYLWQTLTRVFSHSKDRGRIKTNPCEKGGRLYKSDRKDKIWSDAEIAKMLKAAPKQMVIPIELASWTGQRQGDLLRPPWTAYDGASIRLKQSKTQACRDSRRRAAQGSARRRQARKGDRDDSPELARRQVDLRWIPDVMGRLDGARRYG
jgi:hypothetical protein